MFQLRTLLLSAVVALALVQSAYSQNDETVREGTFGRDVTEAVLRRIEASSLFTKDNSFLTRLAYVESRFGTANNTFREEYYGGIWQVEESVFRVTQSNHSSLNALHLAIQARFGVDWLKLKWSNLVVPLYSGLAAALYFHRVPEPIPDRISLQADHWKKWYRPLGEVNKFINDSEELRNETKCRGKMDLCIVLDSSGSIGNGNYRIAKDFAAQLIEAFTLDYNRIGMLIYSNNYRDIFPIVNNFLIPEMATKARNAAYLNAGTRTDLGIYRAVRMFQDTPINQGVPRLVFVFTDGNSDTGSDLQGAVKLMADESIKSVAVGIGRAINREELQLIAQQDNSSVFLLTDFEALQDFLFEITSVACETPQRPELNGTVTDAIEKDEKRLYQIDLPDEGITVKVNVKEGKTNGYWSWTEKVPSSAVNDGVIDGPTYIPPPPPPSDSLLSYLDNRAAEPASVFITIQGVEEKNNYTISTEGGLSEDVTTETEEESTTTSSTGSAGTGKPTGTTPGATETTTEGAATLTLAKLAAVFFVLVNILLNSEKYFL